VLFIKIEKSQIIYKTSICGENRRKLKIINGNYNKMNENKIVIEILVW